MRRKAAYQLAYYCPDPILGQRLLLGALVSEADGRQSFVTAPVLPPAEYLVGRPAELHMNRVLGMLRDSQPWGRPSVVGPAVHLGGVRSVRPVDGESAEEWVTKYVLGRMTDDKGSSDG